MACGLGKYFMFKSKVRPINVPHYEHSRLAGVFASLWGNKDYDKPVIDNAAFVQGVALHDWHYGTIDNLSLGEASEADWLEVVHKGIEHWYSDPTTDIVIKLHIRRLLSGTKSPEVERLVNLIDSRISVRLPQTSYTREQLEWADKITQFCDYLAFDFSFEAPVTKIRSLYSQVNSNEETQVTYRIRQNGEIKVKPWLFSLPYFSGIIFGYERSGYPDRLQPIVIPYRCQPTVTT
jgi:hypothetical protein